MRSIGTHEARTHFSRLLDEVANGERITITKRGVPVAILVPPSPAAALDAEALMQWMREFRKGNRLDGVTIRELIDEGRR
ncbi:MAG TPA: type II toxin-antitoxin system prevent-host-death family antitoxin [Candidatus Limnocylindrales bacterium]|jgi:prevent-host-death family protein